MKRCMVWMLLGLLLTGCAVKEAPAVPEWEKPMPEQIADTPAPPVEETDVPEKPEERADSVYADWQIAYAAFLEQSVNEAVWFRDPENPNYDPNWVELEVTEIIGRYVLYDIDKNGVPELLVRYGGAEANYHTTVYGYAGDEVVELGDVPSGHSGFYAWPGENAIARDWGHMGGHFVEKLSIVNGALHIETVFEEGYAAGEEEVAEYADMRDIVPGSSYLWETRPIVTLPQTHALTLPIYRYGLENAEQLLNSKRNEAAKAAISAVLNGETEFYGVTADGYGGDTGWITMGEYLEPGGATVYTEGPLEVAAQVWEDFNGDGQSEALVTVQRAEGDPYGGMMQVVFSLEEDDVVYAYCMNYMDSYEVKGTEFISKYDNTAVTLAFDGYEAYLYTPGQEMP